MDAIIEYASTPEGMLIVVGVAFIGIVLLLTALIFWIGSLLRRRGLCRRSAAADACSCRTGFLGIPGKTAAEGARSARRHSLSPHTAL